MPVNLTLNRGPWEIRLAEVEGHHMFMAHNTLDGEVLNRVIQDDEARITRDLLLERLWTKGGNLKALLIQAQERLGVVREVMKRCPINS